MNCINKKCAITNNEERMITCWLCEGLCHVKCSGLSGLIADSLSKNIGLHWCCNACRGIGVTFYRFFQGNKKHFLEIQEEAKKLSEKITNYGNLFEDFKCLDSIKSPMQSSPKRRKSSRKNNKEKQDEPHIDLSVPAIQLNPDVASSSVNCVAKDNFAATSSKNNDTVVLNAPLDNVVISHHVNTNSSNNRNYSEVVMDNGNNLNSHRELRVIPPKKQIFISRFAFETTAEDIDFYIKSKLNRNVDITVHKFTYSQARSITSFKITVPFDIFDCLVHPSFWPNHTIVREYEYNINQRANNIVHLPARQSTSQKN